MEPFCVFKGLQISELQPETLEEGGARSLDNTTLGKSFKELFVNFLYLTSLQIYRKIIHLSSKKPVHLIICIQSQKS